MNKLRNSLFLIITLFFLLALTGCTISNTNENLENFYYVMAIGIDKSSNEDDTIDLSIQIATNDSSSDSQSGDSSQSNSSKIYTTSCNSIDSGINILNNYLSKKLNLSHCAAIIFSEEIAKTGIREYVNTLGSNTDIRPTCNIIISNSTSQKALEQISNSSETFSSKYYKFVETTAEYTGYSLAPELSEFLYCMNFGSNSAIATYSYITEETIQNAGIAIFNDDIFKDNLTVLDSISYSLIADRIKSSIISIKNPKNPEKTIDVLLKQIKEPDIKCHLVNNYPFIEINLNLEYNILTSSSNMNTGTLEENDLLEESINNYLKEIVLNFLYKISHKYNVDICNFRNQLSKSYLTLDDFEKIHWEDIYKDSYFEVIVNGKIENTGTFSWE